MPPNSSESAYNLAVYGITGALGRELRAALDVSSDGIASLLPVAGLHTAGTTLSWRGAELTVHAPSDVTPDNLDFAVFATPPDAVAREASKLLRAGVKLLDASGILATPPLPSGLLTPAPLVWPGLHTFHELDLATTSILALPSAAASTIAPVLDALLTGRTVLGLPRLRALRATVLLPASHAGRGGIDALSRQSVGVLNYQPALDPGPFPSALAFNVIVPPPPTTVLFEATTAAELRRLLPELSDISLEFQPIWVSTFSGITAVLHLEFEAPLDPLAVDKVLNAHPDLDLGDTSLPSPSDEDSSASDDDASEAEPSTTAPGELDALALRDCLDGDRVRVATPLHDGAQLRLTLMADSLHRTAAAAATLLVAWMAQGRPH